MYLSVSTTVRTLTLHTTLLLLLLSAMPLHAQWVRSGVPALDTLGTRDRLSLHTNAVDLFLIVPNIGIEYDVAGSRNYNRWTASLDVRYKWHTSHTFVPNFVYNIFEVKGSARNYFRLRHPLLLFYRGGYLSYSSFSLCFGKNATGREGKALSGGVTLGMLYPLYRFRSGRSLDIDLGIDLGIALADYHEYNIDKANNRFYQTGPDTGWKLVKLPIVSALRATFVYRLGRTQGFQKYNLRYDVDRDYAYRMDSLRSEHDARRYRDSISADQFHKVFRYYQERLDSIMKTTPRQLSDRERILQGTGVKTSKRKDKDKDKDKNKDKKRDSNTETTTKEANDEKREE